MLTYLFFFRFVLKFTCSELSDTIMNVVGAFLWVSVGATAIHYWQGYMADHDQIVVVPERTVSRLWFMLSLNYDSHAVDVATTLNFRFRLDWCLAHYAFWKVLYMWLIVCWHSFILQNKYYKNYSAYFHSSAIITNDAGQNKRFFSSLFISN